jgi:hypothetical protein
MLVCGVLAALATVAQLFSTPGGALIVTEKLIMIGEVGGIS